LSLCVRPLNFVSDRLKSSSKRILVWVLSSILINLLKRVEFIAYEIFASLSCTSVRPVFSDDNLVSIASLNLTILYNCTGCFKIWEVVLEHSFSLELSEEYPILCFNFVN